MKTKDQLSLFQAPYFKSLCDYSGDYLKTSAYLDGLLKNGIKPGLERIEILCKKLGDPQSSFPAIQITGTNGKSSVAKMTGAILTASGLKTGVYISPHIFNYRERICVGSQEISDSDFVKVVNKVKKKAAETDDLTRDPLTNFEVITAAAYAYFRDREVDVVVAEVGMGGRYDATSMANPSVSVITNIELDHTEILGKSLEDIAAEKASIIKQKANAVIGKIKLEAMDIIEERARLKDAKLFQEGKDFYVSASDWLVDGTYRADIKGIFKTYKALSSPLPGEYQLGNLSLAVASAELYLNGPLSNNLVTSSLQNLMLPGRQQLIGKNPRIMIDAAHNPAGALKLSRSLSGDYEYQKLVIVISVFKDKDYKGIIEALEPVADCLILTQTSNERSATTSELFEAAESPNVTVEPSLNKAVESAIKMAGTDGLACITGSFSTAAAASDYLRSVKT